MEKTAASPKGVEIHEDANMPRNNAEYRMYQNWRGQKIMEVRSLYLLSGGITRSRAYLLHLAETIMRESPARLTWVAGKSLHALYASLANESEWPGIGFSQGNLLSKTGSSYSINNPLVFAQLVRAKFAKTAPEA